MSISADANADHSLVLGRPTIDINETRGFPQGEHSDLVWSWVMTQLYRTLGTVASTNVDFVTLFGRAIPIVRETPTTSFQPNDLLVTITSARLQGFRELASSLDNHATVANPVNGQKVINAIRHAQRLREP
jgi:hypothetical protein